MSDRALRNLMIAGLIGSIVTICLNIVKALQWVRPGRSLCATNARSALPRAYSSDPVVNNKLLIALWRMVTTGEFRTASCCGKRLSRLADDARKHKEFRRARREFLCLTGRSLSEVVVTRARTWSSNRSLEWARRLGASLRRGWAANASTLVAVIVIELEPDAVCPRRHTILYCRAMCSLPFG